MLHFLPPTVRGCIAMVLFVLNTLFWGVVLFCVAIPKLLLPVRGVLRACNRILTWIAETWIAGNTLIMRLVQRTVYDVQPPPDSLKRHGAYLVISNHRSAVDIPVLQRVFNRRIPLLRFFLKQQLIYVPILGFAWWALDFPFMRRYSRAVLEQHPELRGRDLESARKACVKFQGQPVSILNYLEGTRYTPAKHRSQDSPFRNLLLPRAGGVASVLSILGQRLDGILDVTVGYSAPSARFWDFFCGRLDRVVVRWRLLPVPADLAAGDYETDADTRKRFQDWVNELWRLKDEQLDHILGDPP